MKIGVNLKINVSNIDKAKLFKGTKGTYLDAQVFINVDEVDQYGNNGMITQAITKEERQNGASSAILGNAKIFWSDQNQQAQQQGGFAPKQPAQTQPQRGFAPQQVPAGGASNPMEPPIDFDDDISF